MKRVKINGLLRPNGCIGLDRLEPFYGLISFFTTIPSLLRSEVLLPFYVNPEKQLAGGRINEEYVRALCGAFSLPYETLETGEQVHGTRVIVTANAERKSNRRTDGLVITRPGGCAAVFTADCQAVVLWDPRERTAGVVHAGWRGAVAGITAEAVKVMRRETGSNPRDISACLGPAISAANYPVGPEVVERADARGVRSSVKWNGGKPHLDISETNRFWLLDAGVKDGNIFALDTCTYRDKELFYSYRREGSAAGRLAAVVYLAETS